jgi:RNA polymerase primary sigma factor
MLSSIGTRGLDVVEGEPHSPYSALEQRIAHDTEEVELDLTPGAGESTSDPVRVYLREMGASPLLTREEEVEIAKRIERGQITSLKALSRSPIVIQQVLACARLKTLSSSMKKRSPMRFCKNVSKTLPAASTG